LGKLWKVLFLFWIGAAYAGAEQWYRSNAGGMLLEYMPSRIAAFRSDYCISVNFADPSELPDYLQPYVDASYRIEVHTLYEKGVESRRQWIFRDEQGTPRLVSVMGELSEAEGEVPEGTAPIGFIERYDEQGLINEERLFFPGASETVTAYIYQRRLLIRTETQLKTGSAAAPLTTDQYRYSRSGSLRGVERVYHAPQPQEERRNILRFPYGGIRSKTAASFAAPYGTDFLNAGAPDFPIHPGDRTAYTFDNRGRVLTEIRENEEGARQRETHTLWDGERLKALDWKAGEDEGRTEYEYDSGGNQIIERNYRNGTLERTLTKEGDQETEELYMNGEAVLRAVWREGRKISEERMRKP
jgi:hypothetical protein